MSTGKRALIVLLEMLAEALLLGVLFDVLLLFGTKDFLPGLMVSALPVVFVLCFHGYYFTRPLLGLLWKSGPSWHYAAIAVLLLTAHMGVAIVRFSHDNITPEARRAFAPFLIGGAAIVFCCAFAGRLLLLKWSRSLPHSSENSPAGSEISNSL
jgi:hypothetical protein